MRLFPLLEASVRPRYRESWRHYHNERHLDAVLAAVDSLEQQRLLHDPSMVRLALLYHDAVYLPTAAPGESEEASAALLEAEAAGKVDSACISQAAAIVRATAKHGAAVEFDEAFRADADFALDCDLGILGASRERYDAYEDEIRAEYSFVPEDFFREARARFLEKFLAGTPMPIFRTHHFQTKLEERARENLKRALLRLRA